MKNILLLFLMWPVGMLVAAMSIAPAVIVLRLALPTCKELLAMGDLLSRAPVIRYRLSLVVSLAILVLPSLAVLTWAGGPAKIGYFCGLFLMGIKALGAASAKHYRNNMAEFLASNRSVLSPGFLMKAREMGFSVDGEVSE